MTGPIIDDTEHESSATVIANTVKELYNLLSNYVNQLNNLADKHITYKKTSAALSLYAEQAELLQQAISAIADVHTAASQGFLSDIDDADQEL